MNAVKAKSSTEITSASSALPRESANNCIVAKGTKIEGKFRSAESVRLDGTLVGEVHCDKKLVMGDQSRLEGKLFAQEAVVMGTLLGNVEVEATLHLTATANVQGSIKTKYLIVEEGAVYDGDCQVG
jgi:cytoskeletal protein CcmA (bactofilin family)